jgi:hypothetical protein
MVAYARAHVIRNAVITIDAVTYNNQVTKIRLVPDTPVQTLRTLVPDGVVQDVDTAVWTLELSGIQDMGAGGLAAALNAAAGLSVTVIVQPKAGAGQDVATFSMIAMPVEFGGEQGNFRTFEGEFPVNGQPVFTQSA